MSHQLLATMILASEEAKEGGHTIPATSWMIGGGAFLLFLILLFVVTRLNLDR